MLYLEWSALTRRPQCLSDTAHGTKQAKKLAKKSVTLIFMLPAVCKAQVFLKVIIEL